MKKLLTLALGACLLTTTAFVMKTDNAGIKLGDKAPLSDLKMKSVTDKKMSLNEVKKENGLLVVFSCNTCPFVLAWENRYNEINELANANKVGMVLINSNEAKRSGDDSPRAMKEHASEKDYKMPYLTDVDHKLADAFGARTTPHVYLFNKNNELVYVGAIDDNQDVNLAKSFYIKDAIRELGKGKLNCSVSETKAVGCSIKRVAPAVAH